MIVEPPAHLIERVATIMAVANNGGSWAEHYNEDQKKVWRARARDVIEIVEDWIEGPMP